MGLKSLIKRAIRYVYRSVQSGRFVSKDYAEKHPDVTVRERVDR